MNSNINILYIWTSDNLRLQGIQYGAKAKDICVLLVHGMSGNFTENYFGSILGETLTTRRIGFIYAHNRGYNHINDIATKEIKEDGGYKTIRIGAVYERFLESVNDINAWLNECQKLGYKRIILMGHSLGCNKVIHFYHNRKPKGVIGIILASPPDMVGLAKLPKYQTNYNELIKEAEKNVAERKPRRFLSSLLWEWYQLSSQTFLDLFQEKGPADNLPVLRNPEKFPELASIDIPILGVMGENDDIAIRTLREDLDLIASKAISCPSFTKRFIKRANHAYDRQEKQFANVIKAWIKEKF